MATPTKLLTTLLAIAVATFLFAGCTFLEAPGFGDPGPSPTGVTVTNTPVPPAAPTGGSSVGSPAAAGAPDPRTPQISVVNGRSMKQWANPPPLVIDPAALYTAIINTSAGPITVELFPGDAPNTVNNFVFLAREGFYNNVIFHRAIEGFMIQGGDPTGTGGGGPGYRFADEPVNRPYTRGVIAMANAGPNTNGSQFFLMHSDYGLSPNYTIFGQATGGLDTIDTIATAPKQPGGEGSTPVNPVVIQSVEIIGP